MSILPASKLADSTSYGIVNVHPLVENQFLLSNELASQLKMINLDANIILQLY